jgi:hypothetical protein
MVLVVTSTVGLVLAACWSKGSSIFGFESPFWDLGLIPILTALAIGTCRLGRAPAGRRRFLIGFDLFGLVAVATYVASCSRTARWSPVSALLPFQTGLMLAPDVGASWKSLVFWNILVDVAILVSLPLLVAALGGVMFSVRFTMRRIAVTVAVIAVILGGLVGVGRRIRRYDSLGSYHRNQVVGQVYAMNGADGTTKYIPTSSDPDGRPLTAQQQRSDRWHLEMSQKYWNAARHPWLEVAVDRPPGEADPD